MLTNDQVTALIAEYPTHSDKWLLVREAYRLGVAAERNRCAEVCNRRAKELVERWEKVCGDDDEMIQHAKAHAWTLLVAKCEIERGEDA